VPCLNLSFDVFAVVELRLWLGPMRGTPSGNISDLPQEEAVANPAAVQELEFIGYHYIMLTSDILGRRPWQSVPLVLVKGLLDGEVMPQGTTVSATLANAITYKVQHFDGEITIPEQLAGYLKAIGSIDEMVNKGIMTEKVSGIVKAAIAHVPAERGAPPVSEHAARRGGRKEAAFRLFDQGRRPSSPEIKALSLKPSSAYKYFQTWKRTHSEC